MATVENRQAIPSEALAELEKAVERAVDGTHDPDARRRARERMDRLRDEYRRRHGETSLAVDLIREVRDAS